MARKVGKMLFNHLKRYSSDQKITEMEKFNASDLHKMDR